ncbi:MAG: SDR family NAD(P)-dependent oxidoreductase [bacterium]
MSDIKFNNRVAIITGAGAGLGRSHALALARRGVKIVVNDLNNVSSVVDEITAAGGAAIGIEANVAKLSEVETMIAETLTTYGQIDILVNNAGILRDKSFAKMSMQDFQLVVDVHLMGSANCTKSVWEYMKERNFGRIAMTTSSSGMYGNFGQTNYGAAKAGLSGFMRTLCLEGAKYDIRINALSPVAATQMTQGLMPQEALDLCTVESVSEGLVFLVSDDAPNRMILCAGAGCYAATKIFETEGVYLPLGQQTAENVAANLDNILAEDNMKEMKMGSEQTIKFVERASATIKS